MDKSNIIHQVIISDDESFNVSNNSESIKKFFNNFKHIVWTKKTIISLMEEQNDKDILFAFNNLKPYSFKADLAKYYLVYKFGGWYSDINNNFIDYPPNIENNDFVMFSERLLLTETTWAVQTSIFYADKNHYILKKAIDDIVFNVKNKFYGKHALCPTGPTLFGSAIASFNLPESSNYLIGQFCDDEIGTKFVLNNKDFARYKENGLSAGDPGIPGSNSYVEMWHNKDIYE